MQKKHLTQTHEFFYDVCKGRESIVSLSLRFLSKVVSTCVFALLTLLTYAVTDCPEGYDEIEETCVPKTYNIKYSRWSIIHDSLTPSSYTVGVSTVENPTPLPVWPDSNWERFLGWCVDTLDNCDTPLNTIPPDWIGTFAATNMAAKATTTFQQCALR